MRHSLNFCSWKDRKAVAADLRRIYSAATADQAADELDALKDKWAGKYASIAPALSARGSVTGRFCIDVFPQ